MLRVARKAAPAWERRLAKFGLSNHQIKMSGIQQLGENAGGTFPHCFDPEIGLHWKNGAGRRGLTSQDLSNMSRVSVRYIARDVPDWATNNAACRVLLLHLYPNINHPTLRRRAARVALIIYRAFRQCHSDADIAEELGISRHAVSHQLRRLKKAGRKLFEPQNEKGRDFSQPLTCTATAVSQHAA
jgi:biotin operon repressor